MFPRSNTILAFFNNIINFITLRGQVQQTLSSAFSLFLLYMTDRNLEYVTNKTFASFIAAGNAVAVSKTTMQPFLNLQYPQNEHFLITAIRFLTGASATLAATDWTPGISDAALKNGTMELSVNSSLVIKDFPLTAFQPSTNNNDLTAGIVELANPIMFVAQTPLTLTVSVPTAPTAQNLNIRAELHGYKLI